MRTARALLALMRSPGELEPFAELLPDDWEQLMLSASEQRLTGPLTARLTGEGAPEAVRGQLRAARLRQGVRSMRLTADLARLTAALDGASIRWAVVKGPVLAVQAYDDPGERAFADLDVLVDPGQLGEVLDLLTASGCGLNDLNWPMIAATMRGELSLLLWNGTVLDLHWHLLNTPALRTSFRLPTRELLARTTPVALERTTVPALAQADALAYVSLHACLAGGHLLGWLLDIALLARRVQDWDAVAATAVGTRSSLALSVMLRRAWWVVEPLPDDRRPPAPPARAGWDRALDRLDRLHPLVPLTGRRRTLRTVVSATRATSGASCLALGHQVGREVLAPLLRLDHRAGLGAELHRAAGGPDDRRAFLRAVADEHR